MSPFRASAALTERWEHFHLLVEDGVATVTLARPDKLNGEGRTPQWGER